MELTLAKIKSGERGVQWRRGEEKRREGKRRGEREYTQIKHEAQG